jgi:RNA polymerase sigma-54 factor
MPLELKPVNKLTYKLRLTPHMRLAINLLQMPLVKLKEFIEKQVEENPLLDIENIGLPVKPWQGPELNYSAEDEEKDNYKKSLVTRPDTLQEHLLRQLRLLTVADDERKIGELIIGNIDNNGYLGSSVEDIAESAKTASSMVEKVLSLIQAFDPVGVGARDLRECLLIQLKAGGEELPITYQIIDGYLAFLEKKRFKLIAEKLGVSVERIKKAVEKIAALEPKPGRPFSIEKNVSIIPDAILKKEKGKYEVILNDWGFPSLTFNEKYRNMLKQKDTPKDTKEYLRERLKAAQGLINAINSRRQTIQKVMDEIVYFQKDSLDNGEGHFKSMTLEQIAKGIGKHKSTVSRVVTNKYLQTPQGVFELRYFLNSGIKQDNGELLSSKAVKSKIKDLISRENKEKPLTDQKIAGILKQEGISIARRTIAKYRFQLKMLSSKSRRE